MSKAVTRPVSEDESTDSGRVHVQAPTLSVVAHAYRQTHLRLSNATSLPSEEKM